MLLSIIIPIYNEGHNLQNFLIAIDQQEMRPAKELIVVDDGSTDSTKSILKEFNFFSPFKIISHSKNKGKGNAIRSALKVASGNYIVIQDADFEYQFSELQILLDTMENKSLDVLFGSRYLKNQPSFAFKFPYFQYLANQLLTITSNMCNGLHLTDVETCYKMFKSEIIRKIDLTSDRFGFEIEVVAKLSKAGIVPSEIPISYTPRSYLAGKKITWKDGLAAVWHIFRFNLFQ